MNLHELKNISDSFPVTEKFPILFVGHGSPMNAIEENDFTKQLKVVGNTLPKPKAILVVSAHWQTLGTFVASSKTPRTIYDFGGFPDELYRVEYPANGSPEFASLTQQTISSTNKMWLYSG